jgi:hypothetical protein
MAVTEKNAVFWDVTPCGSYENQRFFPTIRVKKISELPQCASVASYILPCS